MTEGITIEAKKKWKLSFSWRFVFDIAVVVLYVFLGTTYLLSDVKWAKPLGIVWLALAVLQVLLIRYRIKTSKMVAEIEDSLPVNVTEAMAVVADNLDAIKSVVDGHRTDLLARGYNETMAEIMAVHLHQELVHSMFCHQ